jgi:hypothetical protein
VLPTLLGLVGVVIPSGLDGVDVRTAHPRMALVAGENAAALIEPPYKLVRRNGAVTLHDLAARDPVRDVAHEHAGETRRLLRALLALGGGPGALTEGAATVDGETLEELRSLGYIQ